MPPVDIQKCAILKVDPYSATVEIEEPVDVDRPRAEGVPIEPIHTRVGIIVDPIEGRDGEFDIELSSTSSVHSLSAATTCSIHDKDVTTEQNEHPPGMDSDSSEVKGHVTLYGKVVKSIQRSIRRIFQCGKDKTESLGSVQTSDCFAGPPNQASLNQASLNQASLNQASSKQMLSLDSSSSQIDVSMTSIHPLNSPITSVSPDEVSQVAPIHKTLLIDVSYSKPLLSTPLECDVGRKCLVLDLDETLVHSTFQPVVNADLIVPVHLGEGIFQPIYVCKRPGVDEFLREVSKHFEVVLFTASLPNYADPVIDFLDPYCGIRCRLYREDCLQFQGMYIKDLSRLGRDIDQVIIVDNSPASYSMHPQNALGCKSWFRDAHDRELADRILPMLMRLKDSSCVSQWRTENLELINTPYY